VGRRGPPLWPRPPGRKPRAGSIRWSCRSYRPSWNQVNPNVAGARPSRARRHRARSTAEALPGY